MSGAATPGARLALGPVLFNWPGETLRDFYLRIADEADVDIVYLGEVVCAKRSSFFAPYLAQAVERLRAAGKEVVISTLALIMSARELEEVRETAALDDLLVEANDIAGVSLLAGRPHVVGPYVNVYNEGTLAWLAANGAIRVALPVELAGPTLAALAPAAAEAGIDLEVQVFGRLPLALSARCYHARVHGLHKDGCQYVCGEDRDGLMLETIDGAPFLAINGTQTMSHTVCNLIGALGEMRAAGISCFRLSPHDVDMVAVAGCFRAVLEGREDAEAAAARLAAVARFAPFSDGFYLGREGAARGAAPAS